jgi:hypothetical protein
MKPVQRLLVHGALLGVASLGALYVWTRDKDTASAVVADVRVWGGKAADVEKIVFEAKSRKSVLESRKDDAGRWFEGTVTRQNPVKPAVDGGAPPAEPALTVFPVLSVKTAERIAEAVAPLQAVREVGRLAADQAGDFGLAEPEGTLTLTIGGVERKLAVGAAAPGGADRYVRNMETDIVYAVRGDFLRDLLSGESVLNERDLHGFEDDEVKSVRIVAGDKSREVQRAGGAGATVSWSDAATPDKPDEAIASWMMKVARLRPTEYLAEPPTNAVPVVRLEYAGKKGPLGFLELQRLAEEKAGYLVRTEHTRKFAKVFPSAGEQVEQEIETLLR